MATAIVDGLLNTDPACLDALEVKAMVLQARADRAGAEVTFEDDSTFAGIIADGHHLHSATLRVAVRAKGVDRLMR